MARCRSGRQGGDLRRIVLMRLGLGLGLPYGGGAAAFSPLSLAPLAYWPLNDGSGTAAVDLANGYDLTLSNDPAWTAGGGLTFDGVDQKGETDAAGLLAA